MEILSSVFCFWVWLKAFSCCLLHVLFSWHHFRGACFFIYIFWFFNFYSIAIVIMCGFLWFPITFILHIHCLIEGTHVEYWHSSFKRYLPFPFSYNNISCSSHVFFQKKNSNFHPISDSCMIQWERCLYNYTTLCFATNIILMNLIYFLPFVLF